MLDKIRNIQVLLHVFTCVTTQSTNLGFKLLLKNIKPC